MRLACLHSTSCTIRQRGNAPAAWDAVECSQARRVDAVRRAMNTQLHATWAEGSRMYARPRTCKTWHGLRRRIGSLLNHTALAGLEIDMLDTLLLCPHSAIAPPSQVHTVEVHVPQYSTWYALHHIHPKHPSGRKAHQARPPSLTPLGSRCQHAAATDISYHLDPFRVLR